MGIGRAQMMGLAGRALNELMLAGLKQSDAAGQVARAIQVGKPPGHEKCKGATIIRWRDRLSAGEGAAPKLAIDRYHADVPGVDPSERANYLLNWLRRGTN